MAEFLFREDPYLTNLQAVVKSIEKKIITIDKTIFYSFAGGQESDSGSIGNIEIIDSKKDGEEIYYTLKDNPTFKVGDTVKIIINKEKREKIMKLHSALHIVADFFEKRYNIPIKDIVGSSVDSTKGRVDYLYPENLSHLLPELEIEVNNFLKEKHEIKHSKKEGDKWEWKCLDFICPCGGTHVRNTSEIDKIKLKRKNRGAGKERIEVYLNNP